MTRNHWLLLGAALGTVYLIWRLQPKQLQAFKDAVDANPEIFNEDGTPRFPIA